MFSQFPGLAVRSLSAFATPVATDRPHPEPPESTIALT